MKFRSSGLDWWGRPRPWLWSYGWGVLLLREVLVVAGLSALVLIAGCSAVDRTSSPVPERPDVAAPVVPVGPLAPSQLAVLLSAAEDLIGVPYRFNGQTPKGFDCSGFTSFVFREARVDLPRTADEQARAGVWVALDEVRPGDLLFFADETSRRRDNERLTHVGVVVSGPEKPLAMIHASTSKGVTRTEVTRSRYWRDRLRFARRPAASLTR